MKKNLYEITVKFKNDKSLMFDVETNVDLHEGNAWDEFKKGDALFMADYIIATDEILWMKIEGGKIEEHSRK